MLRLHTERRLSRGSVMAKGSTLVIIVALAGNLAIALAKFVAPERSGYSSGVVYLAG